MAGGRLWRFPVVGYVWFCGPVVGCELVGLVALWFAMGRVAPWLAVVL